MDKCQILTLLWAEISSQISGSIPRRPQRRGINDEHTIPGRSQRDGALSSQRSSAVANNAARKIKRAQILLAADAGASDDVIANTLSVGKSTVYRTKGRFVQGNLDLAFSGETRPGAASKRRHCWWPQVDGSYVARMEDVLDLYAEEADPKRPVVCFDESPTQLIGEVREPIPAGPGQPERYDYEYHRNGTANLFVFLDAHRLGAT